MAEASVIVAIFFWTLEMSFRNFVNVVGGELIVELDAGGVSGGVSDSAGSSPHSGNSYSLP